MKKQKHSQVVVEQAITTVQEKSLQPSQAEYYCKHCNNKLDDAQTFHEQCFRCGKKPL